MKFVISDVVAHSSRLLPGAVAPGDQRVFSPRPRCLGKRSVRGNDCREQ